MLITIASFSFRPTLSRVPETKRIYLREKRASILYAGVLSTNSVFPIIFYSGQNFFQKFRERRKNGSELLFFRYFYLVISLLLLNVKSLMSPYCLRFTTVYM